MEELTLLHNPRCSKSRGALAAVTAAGDPVQVVEYLKTPLDAAALTDLLAILDDPPSALVRRDPLFTELGLTADDVQTAEQVVAVLAEHPALMERPVVIRGGRAIIGRPTERVTAFLDGA
ncbi:MAG: ArsC/Spx/MgsR family protein [Kineosporiaceae bacterium]